MPIQNLSSCEKESHTSNRLAEQISAQTTERTLVPAVTFSLLRVSTETRSNHGHNQPLNHVVCSQVKKWSPLSGLFLNLTEGKCNEFALPGVPYVLPQCPWAWQRLLSSSGCTSVLELRLNSYLVKLATKNKFYPHRSVELYFRYPCQGEYIYIYIFRIRT